MSTATVVDPTTLYGPNDHTFQLARSESGEVLRNKEGQPVAVYSTPGLGPEADAILIRESPRARTAILDAREAKIREEEERIIAARRELQRELDSLPKAVRERLQAAAAAGE